MMNRKEAIAILKNRDMHGVPCGYTSGYSEALDMAIESLSTDTVSREFYEDAVKANHGLAKENSELRKQIESAKPTDLISRTDAIEAVRNHISDNDYGDDGDIGMDAGLELAIDVIKTLTSAEQITNKLKKPCNSLLTDNLNECKEQKSKLDLISRADAIGCLPMSLCYDNEPCVDAIKSLPSADRPSGEWIRKDDVLEALGEEPLVWNDTAEEIAQREQWRADRLAIESITGGGQI